MKEINITIRDKIAENVSGSGYVCGNSDYTVVFDFDSEWDEFDTKTARFVKQDRTFTDVVFSGNECPMPILSNTYNIYVGVFAGDLHTTTPAHISAKKSILCDGGTPAAPSEDVYAQIIALLNSIEQPTAEDIQYQATIEKTPVENVAQALDLLKEGAGGAKTWADLGGYVEFDITWDGTTEGREVISETAEGITLNYYKVSDEYLTADQLMGAVMTVSGVADSAFSSILPETYTITAENVSTEDTGVVSVGYQNAIIWVKSIPSGTEYGSQGVYVLFAGADALTEMIGGSVTFTEDIFATKLRKTDIHTIPEDYLPESITTDISGAKTAAEKAKAAAEVAVKTVNGAEPDEHGNVEVVAGVQPDWNQNDENALDYVKNRPFYEADSSVLALQTLSFQKDISGSHYYHSISGGPILESGVSYLVVWDGTEYLLTANSDGAIGNPKNYGSADIGEDIPFHMRFNSYTKLFKICTLSTASRHTVSISSNTIVTLPEKYLPSHDHDDQYYTETEIDEKISVLNAATDNAQTAADNAQTAADNAQTAADNAQTAANEALPKSGGTMTGSLILKGAPTEENEAVTKEYADEIIAYAKKSFTRSKVFPATVQSLTITVPKWAKTITGTRSDGTTETYYYLNDIIPYASFAGNVHRSIPGDSGWYQIYGEEYHLDDDAGFFSYKDVYRSNESPAFVSVFYGYIDEVTIFGTTFNNLHTGFYVYSDIKSIRFDNAYFPLTNQLVLPSSTKDSAKSFRITVDDSGTLSATEVTE